MEMCEKDDKSQAVGIDCCELNRFSLLYIHTSKIVAKSVNQNQLDQIKLSMSPIHCPGKYQSLLYVLQCHHSVSSRVTTVRLVLQTS